MSKSFIERIARDYVEYRNQCGTPILVSVLIAQACVESGYGVSELARNANNYAGIKFGQPFNGESYNGESYTKVSLEEENGVMIPRESKFCKFKNIQEFIKYHCNFCQNLPWREKYYANVLKAKGYKAQSMALSKTYATDSNYGQKLINVIETYRLFQYDDPSKQSEMSSEPKVLKPENNENQTNTQKGNDNMINKPKRINASLLQAGGMNPIKGVVVHNDAGSLVGTPEWYLNWLRKRDLGLGIAHYYITEEAIGRFIDTNKIGWHTANGEGNGHYIGYEVCQSIGASKEEFLRNEDMTLRQVAEDMLFYKLPVNRNTVRLHKEFSSTTCPHRSWDLHGKSINAVKDYFIARIKYYQSLGKTVDEMIDAENGKKPMVKPAPNKVDTVKPAQPKPAQPKPAQPKPAPIPHTKKTVDQLAQEVMLGRWGNGQERIDRLTKAGYDPKSVQTKVDAIKKKKPVLKSNDAIAREVIAGKWGNGDVRFSRLKQAGYNPNVVQDRVNQLLK